MQTGLSVRTHGTTVTSYMHLIVDCVPLAYTLCPVPLWKRTILWLHQVSYLEEKFGAWTTYMLLYSSRLPLIKLRSSKSLSTFWSQNWDCLLQHSLQLFIDYSMCVLCFRHYSHAWLRLPQYCHLYIGMLLPQWLTVFPVLNVPNLWLYGAGLLPLPVLPSRLPTVCYRSFGSQPALRLEEPPGMPCYMLFLVSQIANGYACGRRSLPRLYMLLVGCLHYSILTSFTTARAPSAPTERPLYTTSCVNVLLWH